MVVTLLAMLLAVGPALTVDEAFAVLGKRAVSEKDYVRACERIERGCADGDEACVRRLVEMWLDKWSQQITLELACKKADDRTLPIILDAVREAMKHQDDDRRSKARVSEFFHKPARVLCRKLKNPEPVVEFALDNGYPIASYPISVELKDKYILETIRRQDKEGSGGGSHSVGVSDNAMAPLRELMREMVKSNPRSDGAWTAIETLVEMCDTSIIPDLEAILASRPFPEPRWTWREGRLLTYLAKLRFQGQPGEKTELMQIVRTERKHLRLLEYAVWRLLYIKMDRQSIIEALESNKQTDDRGRDITAGLLRGLTPERTPATPAMKLNEIGLEWKIDVLIFDAEQRKAFLRDSEASRVRSEELKAEEQAILRSIRLAPGFGDQEVRKDADKWKREHPHSDEARRLDEIAEAKKVLWHETMHKYMLGAILSRAPENKNTGD